MTVARYLQGERPSLANLKKLKRAMPKLNEGYDIYRSEVLPWLQSTLAREAAELTGLSRRTITRLKSGVEKPGGETLEMLVKAMNTMRKGKEWEDNLYPRFLEIPASEFVRSGFTKSYISYLRSGKRKPSPRALEKLREVIHEYESRNSNNLHR